MRSGAVAVADSSELTMYADRSGTFRTPLLFL